MDISVDIPFKSELELYLNKLIKEIKPKLVAIIGSLARGTFGLGSDIDLIIVSDNLPDHVLDRLSVLLQLDEFGIPIEPVGLKVNEFLEMCKKGHATPLEVFKRGIIIHSDKRFFELARKLLEDAIRKYEIEEIKKGWIKRKI